MTQPTNGNSVNKVLVIALTSAIVIISTMAIALHTSARADIAENSKDIIALKVDSKGQATDLQYIKEKLDEISKDVKYLKEKQPPKGDGN